MDADVGAGDHDLSVSPGKIVCQRHVGSAAKGEFGPAARAGLECLVEGECPKREPRSRIQCVLPEQRGRYRALERPARAEHLGRRRERGLDLLSRRARITRIGFERVDGVLQQFMNELAIGARVKRERLIVFGDRAPA